MTRDSGTAPGDNDDDALSWAGDDDPTLSTAPAKPGDALAPGWTVVGEPGQLNDTTAEAVGDDSDLDATTDAAAASSTALIVLGILGGVYLLYTVGWAIAAGRVVNPAPDAVGAFMFSLGLWLAAAAPALWFTLSLWLTRSTSRLRYVWLLLGVVVLIPLPFVAGVGVGA